MKRFVLVVVFLVSTFAQLNAQEAKKFRFDIQLGFATVPESTSGGVLINLEPKFTLNEKMNVGLRIGGAVIAKNVQTQGGDIEEAEVGFNGSYLGTFDYYFHKSGSSFAPFVGAGIGYNQIANVDTENDEDFDGEIELDGKIGGMVRVGFDWFKFRLSAEYNLIPKSDLRDFQNKTIGTSTNSYLGLSLGFYFGGGKWKRS